MSITTIHAGRGFRVGDRVVAERTMRGTAVCKGDRGVVVESSGAAGAKVRFTTTDGTETTWCTNNEITRTKTKS